MVVIYTSLERALDDSKVLYKSSVVPNVRRTNVRSQRRSYGMHAILAKVPCIVN